MGMARAAFVVALVAVAVAVAIVQLSPIQNPAALFLPEPPEVTEWPGLHVTLKEVGRIGDGKLLKPEDVAVDPEGRFVYAGCEDGWIRRVERASGHVEDWVHIKGGRPLGLAIGPGGRGLIVCEPEMGLLNVSEDGIDVLANESDGIHFKVTDGVITSREDGSIFFTDGSHKYSLEDHMLDALEARPNGRLLKYDPKTKKTTTLLRSLYFANGVALSKNEDFLVFCESMIAQCKRYWLKGEKAGHVEIFIDNLPSFPDNIKNDGKGRFWIGLYPGRKQFNWVQKYPLLKRILSLMPNSLFNSLIKGALVLVIDEDGNKLFSFGESSGRHISLVTTAYPYDNDIYLGNLGVDFLGHIKLNDIVELASALK